MFTSIQMCAPYLDVQTVHFALWRVDPEKQRARSAPGEAAGRGPDVGKIRLQGRRSTRRRDLEYSVLFYSGIFFFVPNRSDPVLCSIFPPVWFSFTAPFCVFILSCHATYCYVHALLVLFSSFFYDYSDTPATTEGNDSILLDGWGQNLAVLGFLVSYVVALRNQG